MTRKEFFNKTLLEGEYASISKSLDSFEERVSDLVTEVRSEIEGIMETLYKKKSSTEFNGRYYTLINRQGEIGVIEHSDVMEDGDEISLDDIEDVNVLISILCEFV